MNKDDMRIAKRNHLSSGKVYYCRGLGVRPKLAERTPKEVRTELNSENNYNLIFAGELSGRKNQKFLISSMPRIKEFIPHAKLWLLGDGEKQEELTALSKALGVLDSVKFFGYVENPIEYMRDCDLYVSAARSEGLPFNIVEALASGAYTIASDVKGHRDVLPKERLFSLGDDERALALILGARDITPPCEDSREAAQDFLFDTVFYDTYKLIKEGIE
jgi:glycosyltransferase EpsD